MAYRAILKPPGSPEIRETFPTRARALRAARQSVRRDGGTAEVVWCNDLGVEKVWLAFVTWDGVSLTDDWV